MANKASARNGFVDIQRAIFAVLVVVFHFYNTGSGKFALGKIGVEFFVILSGFLFFSGYSRRIQDETPLPGRLSYWKSYMTKRYIRFFWNSLIAWLFCFAVIRLWVNGVRQPGKIADYLSGDIWEILMLKMNGMNRNKGLLNAPAWTLSSMIISEFFILGMLVWCRRFFLTFFMPLSLLCGIGYWLNMESAAVGLFLGFTTFGTLRVYLLTCIGILSYLLCQYLNKFHFTKMGKWILTAFEWFFYTLVLYIAYRENSRNYQMCCILLLALAFSISFSSNTLTTAFLRGSRFTSFLGEFSFSLFLTHYAVRYVYLSRMPDAAVREQHLASHLIICFVVALIYTYFMRAFLKFLPMVGRKLKQHLIEDDN